MATIYKIEFDEYIYIGSTVNMKQRQWHHNCRLNGNTDRSHLLLYTTAREKGIKEFELNILEKCSIDDRFIREQHYIDLNQGDKLLNCKSAKCNRKEYYERNKEEILLKKKKYHKKNADIIKERKRIYCENNKEALIEKSKKYREKNPDVMKEWREKNKERLKEQRKQYCEKNKEQIKQQRKEYREKKKQAELNDI